jgi:choline dehydrogenase-like flavoprotein
MKAIQHDNSNAPLKGLPDVVVIGSGAGGGTMALRMAQLGVKVLLLERGQSVPREEDNSSVEEVFLKLKYSPNETWYDRGGKPFRPKPWYNIGGATKFFGTVMVRYRESDFLAVEHAEGVSPAWPFRYDAIEPYYCAAEQLFGVHGDTSLDPFDPPRSKPLPFGAVGNEPFMEVVTKRIAAQGLHPYPVPVAVDLHPGGKCRRCATCDGFPCPYGAKNDAETRCVEPALETGLVTLWTGATVRRLVLDEGSRRINAVEVEHGGEIKVIPTKVVVLSAGAINSPVILFRSATGSMPNGLANSSGMVGRNYMVHNLTMMMAISHRKNPTKFQKTMSFNDFYNGDDRFPFPMGNVQTLGRLQAGMLVAGAKYLPKFLGREFTKRSVDILTTTEDLPEADNRVVLDGGSIHVRMVPTNMQAHRELNRRTKALLRRIGFPLILAKTLPANLTACPLGTIRMGSDPAQAPLDQYCRSYDHENLFVVDGSIFPSSGSLNPSLTIVAQSLRAAEEIARTEFGESKGQKSWGKPAGPESRGSKANFAALIKGVTGR